MTTPKRPRSAYGPAPAQIVESEEVRPGIVLDYEDHNKVVAIEVLHLRRQCPDADVSQLRTDVV